MVRQPKFKRGKSFLLQRILSVLIIAPLSVWIIYLGPPYSTVFGGVIALGLLVEWALMCQKNVLSFGKRLVFMTVGTLYLLVSIFWFLELLNTPGGWKLIFWLFALVWSIDISAYLGGSLLKGPKLVPIISPKKTWSGFIVGMIGGCAIGYEASFWFIPGTFSLLGIIALAVIAQLGDLVESQAKRWSHLKDSSSLIPGHGGLLDRLDSLLAVAFVLAIWQVIQAS